MNHANIYLDSMNRSYLQIILYKIFLSKWKILRLISKTMIKTISCSNVYYRWNSRISASDAHFENTLYFYSHFIPANFNRKHQSYYLTKSFKYISWIELKILRNVKQVQVALLKRKVLYSYKSKSIVKPWIVWFSYLLHFYLRFWRRLHPLPFQLKRPRVRNTGFLFE